MQDRDAWIAGDTSCERISAVVYVVTLFPLTLMQDDIRINLWLDSSGQIKRLGESGLHFLDMIFPIWVGDYSSSPRTPARSSASLPEHLISIWLSFSVFTALSINAGKVTLPNANCLTGSSLHSAFMDLSSHRPASDPVLQKQTDTGCCTHQPHSC